VIVHRCALVVWLIAVAVAVPTTVAAQVNNGPFGGLFGRTPEREGRQFTAVEFRTSGSGQFEDGVSLDHPLAPTFDPGKGAYSGSANAALSFGRRGSRMESFMSGGVGYQEYFASRSYGATSFRGGGTLRARPTTRVTVDSAAHFSRQPYFQVLPPVLAATPQWVVPIAANPFAARLLVNDSLDGQVGSTYQPTKRFSTSAYVTGRQMRFHQEPDHDFDMVGGQGGARYQISRDTSFGLAYGRENYRTRKFGEEGRYVHEYLEVSLDFLRDIKITRRTSFGITTQTSVLREGGASRKYRLNGSATLSRLFQRTWRASLSAQRRTEFLPGFFKPLFSDQVNASVGGMFTPRVDWFALAGGGVGQFGFDASGRFRSATATTRLNVGLSRRLGTFVQYSFYHYELPPGTDSLPVLDRMSRQSVVAGFNIFVPLYSQVREPGGPQ